MKDQAMTLPNVGFVHWKRCETALKAGATRGEKTWLAISEIIVHLELLSADEPRSGFDLRLVGI
jgi:hypothetical protein